jgi:parallel beta-helix repeat protein
MTIDSSILPDIGYLALINSTNVIVRDMNVMYNGQGILFAFTNNSIIEKVSAIGNWNGIEIQHSSNVTVSENKANNNGDFGIKFEHSATGIIIGNEANNNGWAGIGVFTSSEFSVAKNTANNNIYGIDLVYSKNNLVTLNSASNTIDKYSIAVYYSNSNIIYRNNFVNHLIFRDKDKLYVPNTWDNNLEGNYWTAYSGRDTDQDGIGDAPYPLEEGNKDNYPLMGMFSVFQATPEFNITIISNSNISNFQFDQQHKGISFDATGESGTQGFSRLRLPKSLVGESYKIYVNGQEPTTTKQLPNSNDTFQYIYITYLNSTGTNTGIPPLFLLLVSILSLIVVLIVILKFGIKKRAKSDVVRY